MKFGHFAVLSIEMVTSRVIELCSHLVVNDSGKPATSFFGKEGCHNLNCRYITATVFVLRHGCYKMSVTTGVQTCIKQRHCVADVPLSLHDRVCNFIGTFTSLPDFPLRR